MNELRSGAVVAAYGRRFLVELAPGEQLPCIVRGKRGGIVCGDEVSLHVGPDRQGVIESVSSRRTLIVRSTAARQKAIAANVTQIVVIVAAEPLFSADLLARILAGGEHAGVRTLIALNKADLPRAEQARERLEPFAQAHYPVIEMCALRDVEPLRARLVDEATLLLGQSGMGKSTIVNALVPGADAITQEISRALGSGRHTTTFTRSYAISPTSTVIDSPGLQNFGLSHLSRIELESSFPDVRSRLGHCRFPDCRHATEPDCAVLAAVARGDLARGRYDLMRAIVDAEHPT